MECCFVRKALCAVSTVTIGTTPQVEVLRYNDVFDHPRSLVANTAAIEHMYDGFGRSKVAVAAFSGVNYGFVLFAAYV